MNPTEAEGWIKGIVRVFRILGVADTEKIILASFNLKGDALAWWENYHRHLTTTEA